MMESLQEASRNEIILGRKQRESERLNVIVSQQKMNEQNLSSKYSEALKVIEVSQRRIKLLTEEINRLSIQLNIERKNA